MGLTINSESTTAEPPPYKSSVTGHIRASILRLLCFQFKKSFEIIKFKTII